MTGTHFHYFALCKRKLWLFVKSIDMEHNSDLVRAGRFISDNSFKRQDHEIRIGDISLDYFDRKNKIIHEIKKSDAMEDVHLIQVKYYLFYLERLGINGLKGELHYPKLKQKLDITLTDQDRSEILHAEREINAVLAMPAPPPVIDAPFCKKCSYYELCYS